MNALNGFGTIYASPPDRTPPIVQSIIMNLSVVFAIPASKYWLDDKKKYLAPLPIISLSFVILGIIISIIPTLIKGTTKANGWLSLVWILIFTVGILFGALYNVRQQLYLITLKKERVPPEHSPLVDAHNSRSNRDIIGETLNLLLWNTFTMFLWFLLGFWLDILPFFGASSTFHDLKENLAFGLGCNFGAKDHCHLTWLYGLVFVLGYIFSYWGSARLNESSATFSVLSVVPVTPITVVFWIIYYQYDPNSQLNKESGSMPLWSVIPALFLLLVGVILWKKWEIDEEKKSKEMYIQ